MRLLVPVGIDPTDLDDVWLADMTAFGVERGQIAHTSANSYRATLLPDPKLELQRVNGLLAGLRAVDELLNRLAP